MLGQISTIEVALGAAVLAAALLSLATRRRGGRFRGLPGWAGFWVFLGAVLVCLSRAPLWVSFLLLAALMFATLRAYFFLAPVRPGDRIAIHASYVSIPFVLYPAYINSPDTFLATVPLALFLLMPLLIAVGSAEEGLLDSMGRTLLGVLFFLFCTAHLGLMAHTSDRRVVLFGVLVLSVELVQRLIGRFRPGEGRLRPTSSIVAGLLVSGGLGYLLGPSCGLGEEDAARAGVWVAIAVTAGAIVTDAVARDLDIRSSASKLGRAAFLDRTIPAVYAAPVYFHYLNHFV